MNDSSEMSVRKVLRKKQDFENLIRDYFRQQDVLEVRTPLLVRSPGMEPHLRPMKVSTFPNGSTHSFLPTSPEFQMKILLTQDSGSIFQIQSAFRDEPMASTHLPEFTLLEWYRIHFNLEQLMSDCENLVRFIANKLGKSPLNYQQHFIDLDSPWIRKTVPELFSEHLEIDLISHVQLSQEEQKQILKTECVKRSLLANERTLPTWDDYFFLLWMNEVETKLSKTQPTFISHYPESQAALSQLEEEGPLKGFSRRFELFIGGLELANAFQEQMNPTENRLRYQAEMKKRNQTYGSSFPSTPLDSDFISAIQKPIAPTSGIALGIDRLMMLFFNQTDIQNLHPVLPYWNSDQ